MWPLHMALAAIWAHDLQNAARFIAAVRDMPNTPGWARWAVPWLGALVAEQGGDEGLAVSLLNESVEAFNEELPLYRAHVLADLARLLRNGSQDSVAPSGRAEDIYRSLGASPYLSRAEFSPETSGASAATDDVFSPLSDRERDVATLVIEGLSYAQISRELFITRATVGFHLGRIYAKTGVASRHELVDVAHRNSVPSR
jgi:DNA-binding CsgD family transcriptional regulator